MATIAQLLKLQEAIKKDEIKLISKKAKRKELIDDLGLNKPNHWETKAETFVSINDNPHRIWVYHHGELVVEEIKV